MAKLVWNEVGKRFYEAGVDHGVLYPNSSPGVAWNGLISVERNVSGGEMESYHFDGIKYFDHVLNETFQATLKTFAYPKEFEACLGRKALIPGMSVGKQPRETFGFAWRSKIGSDLDEDLGYKLHMVYNATASPSSRVYQTIGESPTPVDHSWTINAVPNLPGFDLLDPDLDPGEWVWPEGYGMPGWPMGPDGNTPVKGWKATPYIWVDSNKVDPVILKDLEDRLFGTDTTWPHMPSQFDVANILNGHDVPLSYPPDWNIDPTDPTDPDGWNNTDLSSLIIYNFRQNHPQSPGEPTGIFDDDGALINNVWETPEFSIPGLELDGETHYEIEFTWRDSATASYTMAAYSMVSASQSEFETFDYEKMIITWGNVSENPMVYTFGPGSLDYDSAYANGETKILFQVGDSESDLVGVKWRIVEPSDIPDGAI